MASLEPDFFNWDLKAFVRTVFGPPTYEDPVPGEPDWSEWQNTFRVALSPGEDFDPERLLLHAARFCREAGVWMPPYSGQAFSHGTFQLFCHLTQTGEALFEYPTPFEAKKAFVESIPELYLQLAPWKDPQAEMAQFGLWDALLYGFKSGSYNLDVPEIARLHGHCFDALARQLGLDLELAQDAALHGLNHLAHPGRPALIQAWVGAHPDLGEQRKGYALQCAAGEAL